MANEYIDIAMRSMRNALSAETHTEIDKAHLQLKYKKMKKITNANYYRPLFANYSKVMCLITLQLLNNCMINVAAQKVNETST